MKESNIIHSDTITNFQEGLNFLYTINGEQHTMISQALMKIDIHILTIY